MPYKDIEKRRKNQREWKRKKRAEKKKLAELDKRLQEKLRMKERAERKENQIYPEEVLAQINAIPAVPVDPEELKNHPQWGKEVNSPFVNEEPITTDEPQCFQIQSKLRNGKRLTISEMSHMNNCDECALCYKNYGYSPEGFGHIGDFWEGDKKREGL